jgi:hypothetical protein
MLIAYSKSGIPIRITRERWSHITNRHPEMENQKEKVLETIAEPDLIQAGDFGERLASRLYPRTPLTRKYLTVAYREIGSEDGFLITAYFAKAPSQRRKVIWKR